MKIGRLRINRGAVQGTTRIDRMNVKDLLSNGCCLAASMVFPLLWVACNSNPTEDPMVKAQTQEIEQLRQENQELAQAQSDNQEAQKLKKENQDLPKLRSQYQEATRLKKENEQLRQQIQKISPSTAASIAPAGATTALAGTGTTPAAASPEKSATPGEEFSLNDGDDILVDPKSLKQLLPDFDWEKLGRKEPLGIRALIEKNGLLLTNALQLEEYGITNFVIQRAVAPPQPQGQEATK